METFDDFTIRPKTMQPQAHIAVGSYTIFIDLMNGGSEVDNIVLYGPLTPKNKTEQGYAFGRVYRGMNYGYMNKRPYAAIAILYGQTDEDPAKVIDYTQSYILRYATTTKIAKQLVDACEKHTLMYAVTLVTTAPRRAKGPATKEGQTPRDPDFQRLPDVGKTIRSFLGGKKRRKTARRRNVYRKK
jgi:hypothetical protein